MVGLFPQIHRLGTRDLCFPNCKGRRLFVVIGASVVRFLCFSTLLSVRFKVGQRRGCMIISPSLVRPTQSHDEMAFFEYGDDLLSLSLLSTADFILCKPNILEGQCLVQRGLLSGANERRYEAGAMDLTKWNFVISEFLLRNGIEG